MLVVGAGMVGGTLALGLSQQGFQVTVVDPSLVKSWDSESAFDLRISAVTADNVSLLEQTHVWQNILACRANPFLQLAVADSNSPWLEFGSLKHESEPLGYMVENSVFQFGLYQQLEKDPNITLIEIGLEHLDVTQRRATLGTQPHTTIDYDFLLGCDGANSKVRAGAGIGVSGRTYQEACLLVNIKTDLKIEARTWEKFHSSEVHALLPLNENNACLIVYANKNQIKAWSGSEKVLETALKDRFPELGSFSVVSHGYFPLKRQSANHYFTMSQNSSVSLFGDAAHTIHPMAGQGVNLGLRDVSCFLKLVQQDGFSKETLCAYERRRKLDNESMAYGLELVGWGMKSENPFVATLRTLGLNALKNLPFAENALSLYASRSWKV